MKRQNKYFTSYPEIESDPFAQGVALEPDQESDAKLAKEGRVPAFISKAFEIFSNTTFAAYCGWARNGDAIIIHNISEFAANVLPKYFKHSNYASFVRQLNMYDFHKTVANPQIAEFHHPSFIQSRPDLLNMIKRKARRDAVAAQQERLALAALAAGRSTPPAPTPKTKAKADNSGANRAKMVVATASAGEGEPSWVPSEAELMPDAVPSFLQLDNSSANNCPKAWGATSGDFDGPRRAAHGMKRKAMSSNIDFSPEQSDKKLALTPLDDCGNSTIVNNTTCASSSSSSTALRPMEYRSGGSSLVAMTSEQDWRMAVERHLAGCQAEIQSLREENQNLRRCLGETDRRMEALLGFTYSTIKDKTTVTLSAQQLEAGEASVRSVLMSEADVANGTVHVKPTLEIKIEQVASDSATGVGVTLSGNHDLSDLGGNGPPALEGVTTVTRTDTTTQTFVGATTTSTTTATPDGQVTYHTLEKTVIGSQPLEPSEPMNAYQGFDDVNDDKSPKTPPEWSPLFDGEEGVDMSDGDEHDMVETLLGYGVF